MKSNEQLELEVEKLNKKIELLTQAVHQGRTIKLKFNESVQLLKAKDKELEIINEQLEQRVKDEVAKNLQKELRLFQSEKMASMGEMIGNIAHQWRQPLSTIVAVASGIKINCELDINLDQTKEGLIQGMGSIIEKSKYLSETIDTFRNYLREDKEYKEIILQDRIDLALSIVNVVILDNKIELINKIDYTNSIRISLIVGELSQVIINIINNAKDILLENKIKKPFIEIDLIIDTNRAIITIEDNGGGIPDDILPKIFDKYFTTKDSDTGTGLGLHMSYKIIEESLHGKLYATNTKNGAKFFIELPLL